MKQLAFLRQSPNSSSSVVGYAIPEQESRILKSDGDWSQIQAGQDIGYVQTSLLIRQPAGSSTIQQYKILVRPPTENDLFMRATPEPDGNIVRSLMKWDTVEVVSTKDGWTEVSGAKGRGLVPSAKLEYAPIPESAGQSSKSSSARFAKAPSQGPSVWEQILSAMAQGMAQAGAVQAQTKLTIFGGQGHKTYLGCLNCSEFASDSIMNKFGKGNQFSSETIFNHFSEFGSRFSTFSVCNPYATDPPVIVDSNGKYFGRLTLNQYHPEIGVGKQWLGFVAATCN